MQSVMAEGSDGQYRAYDSLCTIAGCMRHADRR